MSAAVVSRIGLPLSHVSAVANFARLASMRSPILMRIRARSVELVRPQASLAAWAASSAASISDASERATSHTGRPIIAETLSKYLPTLGARHSPPMKLSYRLAKGALSAERMSSLVMCFSLFYAGTALGKHSCKADASNRPRDQDVPGSVANLRQVALRIVSTAKTELFQPAV